MPRRGMIRMLQREGAGPYFTRSEQTAAETSRPPTAVSCLLWEPVVECAAAGIGARQQFRLNPKSLHHVPRGCLADAAAAHWFLSSAAAPAMGEHLTIQI